MAKPKHTPGPWKAIALDGETYVNPLRDDAEYALICKLTPASGPRADANARLIAAAPELLDALKAFVDSRKCIGWGEGQCDLWLGQQWHKALDAIRKATREE